MFTNNAKCPDGGIGRRAGLKHQWGNTCAGSTPALGTEAESQYQLRLLFHLYSIPDLSGSRLLDKTSGSTKER